MVSEETVWQAVWPTVEQVIGATLDEDGEKIGTLLVPGEQAAMMLEFFGFQVFDVLLKTVLGRGSLAVTRAIETDNGRYILIEYTWPEPGAEANSYTAADVVTTTLTQLDGAWKIVEINPAAADLPLTGPRARGVLATTQALTESGKVPSEPWILPIALYGGALQIPILETAMEDEVEQLFLPGMQHRTYGVMSLIRARALWRQFKEKATPNLADPAGWAAAVEFIMNEQNRREQTQAAVRKYYEINLSMMVPRVKQIKKILNIQGQDERFTDLQPTRVVLDEQEANGS